MTQGYPIVIERKDVIRLLRVTEPRRLKNRQESLSTCLARRPTGSRHIAPGDRKRQFQKIAQLFLAILQHLRTQ